MDNIMKPTNHQWRPYSPKHRVGKLVNHNCNSTMDSDLPLRNVVGGSTEPNYETATYNYCTKCNQPHVRRAVEDGLSHILFVTGYYGKTRPYMGRIFIVGYYEIGWTATIDDSTGVAVRPRKLSFTRIEDAYEITPERWQQINPQSANPELNSHRYAKQRICGDMFDEIVNHLDAHDNTDDYLREVARLKARYNPFTSIPPGRIFIINVGSNSAHQQVSPLFDDGRFEFVPITSTTDDGFTFGDLHQFYAPNNRLTELFNSLNISSAADVHNDPEFATFTYGDSPVVKPGLAPMTKGDFLFFLTRLVPYRNQRYKTDEAIFALIGFLEIDEKIPLPSDSTIDPLLTSPAFNRNAHVRRWINDSTPCTDGYAVYKGSTNSRRFHTAVRFDRDFVEDVPILTAAGTPWNWEKHSPLRVISSYTRAPRLHIDPSTDEERAARFWSRIWTLQQ